MGVILRCSPNKEIRCDGSAVASMTPSGGCGLAFISNVGSPLIIPMRRGGVMSHDRLRLPRFMAAVISNHDYGEKDVDSDHYILQHQSEVLDNVPFNSYIIPQIATVQD